MAQLVVAAAGAAIGGMIAPGVVAFGMTGAAMGWMAGSVVGNALFAPTQKGEGPRLGDLSVSGSSFGTPIPWVAGSPRIAGQVIWASAIRELATTTEQGKGGGGAEYTSYTYEVDLLIKLTDNIMAGVPQVWRNGELVYSILTDADPATVEASINAGLWSRMTVYTGAADQLPDPDYEAAVGTSNAPAYRGCCTIFIKSLQLGGTNQVPNLTCRPAQHGSSGVSGTGTVGFIDAGPVYSEYALEGYPGDSIYRLTYLDSENKFAFWRTVGEIHPHTYKYTTTDGQTWQEYSCSVVLADYIRAPNAVYGNGRYVFYGDGIEPMGVWLCYSTNGLDIFLSNIGLVGGVTGKIYTVIFDGVKFIALGNVGGTPWLYTSLNGVSFDPLIAVPGGTLLTYLTYDGTNYIISSSNKIVISSNLTAFTDVAIGVTGMMQIEVGNGKVLTLSYQTNTTRVVLSSDHGATFSTSNVSLKPYLIHYLWFDGTHFNVIGKTSASAYILSSSDGVDWVGAAIDDPWEYPSPAAARPRPVSDGNGFSISITQEAGYSPKRVFTYKFLSANTFTIQDPSLQDVVSSLMLRAGYTADQFDVSALPSAKVVRALANSSVSTARTVLEMLASTYFFDAVCTEKIYFVPRGGAPVATITWDELGVTADSTNATDPLPITIANELEIPAQMALTYNNVDGDYQTDTQYSDRLLTGQESTSAVQVPMGFTAAEAKAIVDAMLLDKAVAAMSTSINVDITRAALVPTDVVQVVGEDGSTYRLRITKRTDAGGVTTLALVADDASVLVQAGVTSGGTASQTTVLPVATTALALLDVPLLRDADDKPGLYVAVMGNADNWAGCAIYESLDDVTYTQVTTLADQTAIGACTTTLADWTGGNVFDESNTVTVNVGTIQQLASASRDDVLANQAVNAALIGSELVQYLRATLVSAGVYTLSGLLRGRRGTEWASVGHAASERFVALGASGLRYLTLQSSDLGRIRYYKGVSAGQKLSDVTAQAITPAGVALECLSPVNARADRTTADTVLTWTRRTRLSTRLTGSLPINAPLGEVAEAYDVEVWDSTYTTLKRTLSASTPTATYTSAQQVADFGANQATLYLKIYQLSATVARGYPLKVSV